MQRIKFAFFVLASLGIGGCFNDYENDATLDLGEVSLGQQLIDLKRARDQEAITEKEYEQLRDELVHLLSDRDEVDDEDDDDESDHHKQRGKSSHKQASDDDDDDDGFRWF